MPPAIENHTCLEDIPKLFLQLKCWHGKENKSYPNHHHHRVTDTQTHRCLLLWQIIFRISDMKNVQHISSRVCFVALLFHQKCPRYHIFHFLLGFDCFNFLRNKFSWYNLFKPYFSLLCGIQPPFPMLLFPKKTFLRKAIPRSGITILKQECSSSHITITSPIYKEVFSKVWLLLFYFLI